MKLVPSVLNIARIRPGSDYDIRKKELIAFYESKGNYSSLAIKEIQQQFQKQFDKIFNEIESLKTKQIESSFAKERIETVESFLAPENLYTPTQVGSLIVDGKKISAIRINLILQEIKWQCKQPVS